MTDEEKSRCDRHWPEGYRESFITIWHKDPERDGSDDSCGFTYPKLTKKQIERLHNVAWSESRHPHFLACKSKEWSGTNIEAVSLYEGMVLLVVEALNIKVGMDFVRRYAVRSIHHADCVNPGGIFCFLPGYHTNFEEDTEERRQEHFRGILCGVARGVLYELRPWYKFPRWHFWHWRFQIHPWQSFKRWAFDRCAKCGKEFHWGESVIGNGGNRVWHNQCDGSK